MAILDNPQNFESKALRWIVLLWAWACIFQDGLQIEPKVQWMVSAPQTLLPLRSFKQYQVRLNPLNHGEFRTSLVVQQLRIFLPVQGTWVSFLVREDSMCYVSTKPVLSCFKLCNFHVYNIIFLLLYTLQHSQHQKFSFNSSSHTWFPILISSSSHPFLSGVTLEQCQDWGVNPPPVKNPHITLQSGFLIEDSTPRDSANRGLCSAVVCI